MQQLLSAQLFLFSSHIEIIYYLFEIQYYEPKAKGDEIEGVEFINDLESFKKISDVILANRIDENLEDVKNKVYTRDIYHKDA